MIRIDVELALATGDIERAWSDLEVAFEHWDRYHVAHRYPLLRRRRGRSGRRPD